MNRKLFLFSLVTALVVGLTCATPRDKDTVGKKPAVHKTRSDLVDAAGESQKVGGKVVSADEVTEVTVVEQKEPEKNKEEVLVSEIISDVVDSVDKVPLEDEKFDGGNSVTPVKPASYMTKVKNVLKQLLEMFGLARQKRKNRMMNFNTGDSNALDTPNEYTEEFRATVGAFMGQKDCFKRAACGAGAYLREVRGKEVLIVLMEKLVPSSWSPAVDQLKEAAIYKDECKYECLDD